MKLNKRVAATNTDTTPPSSSWVVVFAGTYVFVALAVDTLAVFDVSWPFDWAVFQWRPESLWRMLGAAPPDWARFSPVNRIDLFKFLFWFVIPFALCVRWMDWRWFSPRGWKRNDWLLLGGMVLLGSLAVASVRFIPALRNVYPSMGHLPADIRRTYCIGYLLWTASWLPGWEFMHRYFLLRVVMRRFPRYGWLLIPLSETLYHLQKPLLEAGGMAVFSLLLTFWAVKRRNLLLPFVAHLYIEILLLIVLVYLL
ncbi:MAG TPA: hypothetical protein ENN29_00280 [Candidatus Hydrogenedentes bacterium]|nr:hypothetical protein [Candidatus Hydrogenedentota bacterium]